MHEGKYRFSCPHCSKGFANKNRMYEHMTSHTGEWYFSCHQCGEKFKNLYGLKQHQVQVHGQQVHGHEQQQVL